MPIIQIKDFSAKLDVDASGESVWKDVNCPISFSGILPGTKFMVRLLQGARTKLEHQLTVTGASLETNLTLGDFSGFTKGLVLNGRWLNVQVASTSLSPPISENKHVIEGHTLKASTSYSIENGVLKEITSITPPTERTIMKQKNFFQSALDALVQFGQGNGFIQFDKAKFSILAPDKSSPARIAVATATDGEDAVNLKQLEERLAELAKRGGIIVTDLVPSPNPWGENQIRMTGQLEFQRKIGTTDEVFVLADGTSFTVAQELEIDAGLIINHDTETKLYPDHVYIFDKDTAKVYDNGAVGEAYDEKSVLKQMSAAFDKAGTVTGLETVPADAPLTGLKLVVTEGFDTDPTGSVKFGGTTLVDFSALDFKEAGILSVPVFAKEAAEVTPTIDVTATGTKGKAAVLFEYAMP